ncbi:co-chaperone GroES, partial [Candidatus Dojkabacteria bacterium]|nr:co-chaperone GroES [Candidatus Dojkabacteria bacterium]
IAASSAKGEKPEQGEVVALGTGKFDDNGKKVEWNVAVGDTVLFRKYSPSEVEMDGEEYLIMKEEDVLAVIG